MPSLNLIISPIETDKRKDLDFRSGDTVRVWQKVKEGDKTRLQAFEGMVLSRKHGKEPGATFIVRKVVSGVGVERIFPLYSPEIDRIERKQISKHKRSKLYYVRDIAAREIRRKMKLVRKSVGPAATDVVKKPKEEKEAV